MVTKPRTKERPAAPKPRQRLIRDYIKIKGHSSDQGIIRGDSTQGHKFSTSRDNERERERASTPGLGYEKKVKES